MPRTDYRPEIGETVFVSLSDNLPMLITITGFSYHTFLKEEVMEFDRLDGASNWSSYKGQTFFPEIPAETPYLYVVVSNHDSEDGWCQSIDEAFFFDLEAAFAHLDAMARGDIPSRFGQKVDGEDCVVEIRRVT